MTNLDGRSTSAAVAHDRPQVAILPVGSFEQHGPHLPLHTDALIASTVAARAGAGLDTMVLPAVPYGTSSEHRGTAGSVWLREETLAAVIQDVVLTASASVAPRVIILSGHGGNWILRPTVRAINVGHPDISVGLVPEGVMWGGDFGSDLHAGDVETSILLHLDPGAVGELPDDFVPDLPREALDLLPVAAVTPDGVWGHPSKASPERGADLLDGMVARVRRYVTQTFTELVDKREQLRK